MSLTPGPAGSPDAPGPPGDLSESDGPDGDAGAGRSRPAAGRSTQLAGPRKWVTRADVERRTTARLQLIEGVIVLNDRRIPGSKSSIKLIAVAPAGVFVIDSKNFKGLVHTKRSGPIRDLGPLELHVGRRNCTTSVEQLAEQVGTVRETLSSASWGSEVPVHALLCLTRAEWGFASPIEIADVWIGWPKRMLGRVQAAGVMDSPTVQEVSEMIAARLP